MNKTENYDLILPGENEPVLIEQLNDNFIKIDDIVFNMQDIVNELIGEIPEVFHDVEQNEIKESMTPADFEYGVTLCSQSNVRDFPTINEYGVSYTLIGRHSNYAQIFITRFGDIWSRRATTRSEWNGEWYNAKNEIEKLELELEELKATGGSQEDINKLEKNIKEIENKIGSLSDLQTENKDNLVNAINELTDKSDLLVQSIDPTPEDTGYKIGQMWFNKENGDLFILKCFDENGLSMWSIFNNNGLIEDVDDITGSPGNGKLLKGTMEEGYFGAVSSSELISGDELASKVSVTQGTAQHSNTPWHKFAYKGKILFVTQKTIKYNMSWSHLHSKNVVYGNKTIEIDGVKYKVRLIKGALTDPSDDGAPDKGAKGSEWNRLILPLHKERKDNSWDYPDYVENDLQDWGTYLSDSDMIVGSSYGGQTLCQEVISWDRDYRVNRGNGVSNSSGYLSTSTNYSLGWRPVLEVVQ